MDTAAFTQAVEDESRRLRGALRRAVLSARVPTAPDWDVADLTWHVAEVQWFWGAIVDRLVTDVETLTEPSRPAPDELAPMLQRSGDDLVAALRRRDPADACWSWHEDGGTVAWVARRQAHEALIHRVDAELAAGMPVTDAADELAADGVDELLDVVLRPPSWSTFAGDGEAVRVAAPEVQRAWVVHLGRLRGTSPNTGTTYDEPALRVGDEADVEVAATVSGRAWDLDRWLWGRGPVDPLEVTGDLAAVHRLRELAAVE